MKMYPCWINVKVNLIARQQGWQFHYAEKKTRIRRQILPSSLARCPRASLYTMDRPFRIKYLSYSIHQKNHALRFYLTTNSSSSNPSTLYRAVITHCKTTLSCNSKSRKHRIDRCSCSSNERQRTNWAFIYALIPLSRVATAAGRTWMARLKQVARIFIT